LNKNRKTLRGVSEIISVILLLGISIIGGYLVFRAFFLQTRQQQLSIVYSTEVARQRISERFTIVDGFIIIRNISTKEFILTIYNHGETDIEFKRVRIPFVSVGGDLRIISYDIDWKVKSNSVNTLRIVIDDPEINLPPGISVRILLESSSGRIFNIEIYTVRG